MIVVGPGRAGGSIALAATRAGHEIVGVVSRSGIDRFGPALAFDSPLPEADLLVIAVRDDSIAEVAGRLSEHVSGVGVAAHVSGFTAVSALDELRRRGVATGGFHPLQTLPDPEKGAAALTGSHVAIGGDPPAVRVLEDLADSLGMKPFPLEDRARPTYHAAASASSNFVITALATAGELFRAAGVDPGVARPLVEKAVANVYAEGLGALTGPIARGDVATVRGQLAAARQVSESVGEQFSLLAEATAIVAGRESEVAEWR